MERGERTYQIIGFFDSLMLNGSFGLIADKYMKMDMGRQYYDELYIKTSLDPNLVSATLKKGWNEDPLTFLQLLTWKYLTNNPTPVYSL